MTTSPGTIDLQAERPLGPLSTAFRWPGNAVAWLARDKARVWLRRKAVATWMNILIIAAAGVAAATAGLLAVAQMTEETGHLTSFWSQRPRRNLAGIGVTGEPGAGVSFPDLKTAVRAHTGRLLAFALPSGVESEAQHQLIEEALAARPLPEKYRGIAPTLQGLAGTWAQDPDYATKVAAVANEIR